MQWKSTSDNRTFGMAVIKNGHLRLNSRLDFSAAQIDPLRIIFSFGCYQRSAGAGSQLCGIMLRWVTEIFACRQAQRVSSSPGPLPLEAGHIIDLSHRVWMKRM